MWTLFWWKKFLIQGKPFLIILIFKKWIDIMKSERRNNGHQISLKDRSGFSQSGSKWHQINLGRESKMIQTEMMDAEG